MARTAVFAGLISDEQGQAVNVGHVGGEACYIVNDAGFERHIFAETVDRQVLHTLYEQIMAQRDLVVEGTLQFIGQEDLFAKAMVEASLDKMNENIEQVLQMGLPEETRAWLGLLGFHIGIDIHGDVVDLELPSAVETDE